MTESKELQGLRETLRPYSHIVPAANLEELLESIPSEGRYVVLTLSHHYAREIERKIKERRSVADANRAVFIGAWKFPDVAFLVTDLDKPVLVDPEAAHRWNEQTDSLESA